MPNPPSAPSARTFRPAGAVFDLDGLMFNTEQLYVEVAERVLAQRGKRFTAELHRAMMGRPAREGLRLMIEAHDLADTPEALGAESAAIFRDLLPTRLRPMPGLFELLDRLERAGIPKAVATGSGREFARRILGHGDLEPRFEFLLCAEDVVHGKPHPEIYLKAAAGLGLEPSRIVVFEDSANGFRAALAAGAVAVAVPGEHNAGQSYDGALWVAETLHEPEVLRRIGLAD